MWQYPKAEIPRCHTVNGKNVRTGKVIRSTTTGDTSGTEAWSDWLTKRIGLGRGAGKADPEKIVSMFTEATYRSVSPVAASSSVIACVALSTLIVAMPISRAGFKLTP